MKDYHFVTNLNDGIHTQYTAQICVRITSTFFVEINEIILKQIGPNMNGIYIERHSYAVG